MKKLTIISFLLLLFFVQIGYHLFFIIQQYRIKEAVKHELLSELPESKLEKIDVAVFINEIEWEEENREFYLNGQMYDVAYIKIVNGKKIIYCLNDKREDEFLQSLNKIVQSENNKSRSDKNHVIKFHLPDFIVQDHYVQAGISIKPYALPAYKIIIPDNITEINTPPPDFNI